MLGFRIGICRGFWYLNKYEFGNSCFFYDESKVIFWYKGIWDLDWVYYMMLHNKGGVEERGYFGYCLYVNMCGKYVVIWL